MKKPAATPPTLIIRPNQPIARYWQEIWEYRELLVTLAIRDVKVRYKQTALGIAWAVLQPLCLMLILTFVRQLLAPAGGAQVMLLILTGLVPWTLFSQSLLGIVNSLVVNGNMISKIYFPRLLVPLSASLVSVVDYAIGIAILCIFLVVLGAGIGPGILMAIPIGLLIVLCSISIGIWVSIWNVKYRDFRYVVPVLIQFGLYISPILYDISLVPERFRFIYSLNPMVGIIELFRWSILPGEHVLALMPLAISLGVQGVLLFFGIRYFRNQEKRLPDYI